MPTTPPAIHLRTVVTRSGRRRLLAEPPPGLAAAYARAVGEAAPRIDRVLGPGVLAGRRDPAGPRPLAAEMAAWRRATTWAGRSRGTLVRGDVRDCYASIGPDAVARALRTAGADPAPILEALAPFARACVRGLPVGPEGSLVLANAVLSLADRAVREAGGTPLRWVDDVILVCEGPRHAASVLDAWARALQGLGLRPHEGKTALLAPGELPPMFGGTSLGAGGARGMLRAP